MINLLPTEIIKINRANYHRRLLTVGLWFLAGVILLALVIDGVRLITINIEHQSFINLTTQPHPKTSPIALAELAIFNKQLSLLVKLDQPNSHLGHLDQSLLALLELRPTSIKFNQLIYHHELDRRSLTINGLATNREALVGFVETLKTWPELATLNAPLDNLVKDKNPAFTITLNLKP
ncbi:MAG: hypothetical protein Q7T49_02085 [bacterium]|nr:hypothetical protein [bacterium]